MKVKVEQKEKPRNNAVVSFLRKSLGDLGECLEVR